MHLLPCHACWLCWLRLPHRPPPHRNRWISYRWLHPGDPQLSVHIGHQALGDLRPRTRDTEIVGLDKLHGESTWVGRPALYLPLDLAQVGNDDDIEISLNGLLTDCDREDRGGKLSSLWRTGLAPWDWTQDTVGPFRFLLPRLCVHSIVQNRKPGGWLHGDCLERRQWKGFPVPSKASLCSSSSLPSTSGFPAIDEVVKEVGGHRDGAGLWRGDLCHLHCQSLGRSW